MSPKSNLERILGKKGWIEEWNKYVGQLPHIKMGGIKKAEAMSTMNWERLYDLSCEIKDMEEKRKTRKALREFGEYQPNKKATSVRVKDNPDGTAWKSW